jgi:hypothetical protein
MYRLIYISSPTREMNDDEVHDLLRRAKINNDRDGITGILIYDRRRYLQYLEGDEARVEATLPGLQLIRAIGPSSGCKAEQPAAGSFQDGRWLQICLRGTAA